MLPRPPAGYVTRRRTPVAGADLATLDAEMEAAGGHVMHHTVESTGLRPGRVMARVQDASWYVIPAAAVED
jgi:hypothetical protein